uniref:Uncharacterized protein n=1 Tax=Tetranychus urticae TaxID=32264 RepID=T1JTU1_TETUR
MSTTCSNSQLIEALCDLALPGERIIHRILVAGSKISTSAGFEPAIF